MRRILLAAALLLSPFIACAQGRWVAHKDGYLIVLTSETEISLKVCTDSRTRMAVAINPGGRLKYGCWREWQDHILIDWWNTSADSIMEECEFTKTKPCPKPVGA